ncbi:hypothetical protein LMG8286_00597 [Campylobacter suis]|uniref:NnrS family protein n=1 Tax=Campylobacter suis TaxID=2790657 RepID=A0ABM8Q253_9BACT|nr:hypothetical protein LMG8286_00597 [Campylobacter suis]
MINDFFTHPMRIFFFCAVFCVFLGCASFFVAEDFVSLHKFAFLGLVCPLAYAGFLFTAIPDWTSYLGSLKRHSIAMFVLFALSFVVMFLGFEKGYFIMGFFWVYLLVFAAVLIFLDKNDDNFSILAVLTGFCILNFLYVFTQNEKFLSAQIHLNMLAVVVVSFRVSVVLGKEAFKLEEGMNEAVFAPNFVYKNLLLTILTVLLLAVLFEVSSKILGFISLGCGFIMMARLHEMHYKVLLKRHFVVFYYLISLIGGLGYIWLGVSEILELSQSSNAIHLIAICTIFGIIMFIFNVAGLRHSGQELVFLRLSRLGIFALFVAGVSRSVFAMFFEVFYIILPAIFLAMTFICWGINFYAIFRDNEFSKDPE